MTHVEDRSHEMQHASSMGRRDTVAPTRSKSGEIVGGPSRASAALWLREVTRSSHERAEGRVRAYLGSVGSVTRARYVDYLTDLLAFYAPLERALSACETFTSERDKSRWLREDLAHFGVDPLRAAARPAPEIPDVGDPSAALGASYVIEGATLGGVFLLKELRASLPIAPGLGGSFLHGYGHGTARAWAAFRAALDDSAQRGADWVRLQKGAVDTFDAFERCLRRETDE
jgi:heme oxygenase